MSDFEIEDDDGDLTFVVTGPWTAHSEVQLLESGAETLILNYARGYQELTLDFLDAWPIKHIELLSRTTTDLTPIYRLAGTLETLALIEGSREPLDYSIFEKLSWLVVRWKPGSLDAVQRSTGLKHLSISAYTETDLEPLGSLGGLRTLSVASRSRMQTLDGIENFPQLTLLDASSCYQLTNIDALAGARLLEELDLQGCKRLSDLSAIENLTELRLLNLGNIGEVESFWPLAGLVNLEMLRVFESTRPLDNDLMPLLQLRNLEHLGIRHRRAYSPGADVVKRELGLPPR